MAWSESEESDLSYVKDPISWDEVTDELLHLPQQDVESSQFADDGSGVVQVDEFLGDPLGIRPDAEVRVKVLEAAKTQKKRHRRQLTAGLALVKPDVGPPGSTDGLGSIDPNLDDFSSTSFLVAVHDRSAYDDLKRSVSRLREAVANRTQQMRALVHEHFDQFIQCKDTIELIHSLLSAELQGQHQGAQQSKTAELHAQLGRLRAIADGLYNPLLARKRESDRIQNSLSVIKRYNFLLRIPAELKRSIRTKQFDNVVREFWRARGFTVTSPVLKRAQDEVEHIAATFRSQLLRKLDDPRTSLSEQETTISLLVELGHDSDPSKYLVQRQHDVIVAKIEQCVTSFQGELAKQGSPARSLAGALREHACRQAVLQLSGVMAREVPEFWLLAHSVSSARLKRRDSSLVQLPPSDVALDRRPVGASELPHHVLPQSRSTSIPHRPSAAFLAVARDAAGAAASQFCRSLVLSVCEQYAEKVKYVLSEIGSTRVRPKVSPSSGACGSPPFQSGASATLAHANCRTLIECYRLLRQSGVPRRLLLSIRAIVDDTARAYATALWRSTLDSVQNLASSETWILDRIAARQTCDSIACPPSTTSRRKRGGGLGVTRSCRLFQDIVLRAMGFLDSLLSLYSADWHFDVVVAPFLESIRSYLDVLHFGAFGEDSYNTRDKTALSCDPQCKKLLATLSNLVCLKSTVLRRLWSQLEDMVPASSHALLQAERTKLVSLCESLSAMVLSQYAKIRSMPLISSLQELMFLDGVSWEDAPEPKSVRSKILDIVADITVVHNEIYMTGHVFLEKVLRRISRLLFDAWLSLILSVDRFSPSGALLVSVELEFVYQAFQRFRSDALDDAFDRSRHVLSQWTGNQVDDVLGHGKLRRLLDASNQASAVSLDCLASATIRSGV